MKTKHILGILAAALIIAVLGYAGVASANGLAGFLKNNATEAMQEVTSGEETYNAEPTHSFVAVVDIFGEIGYTQYNILGMQVSAYNHEHTLSIIDDMIYSDRNVGLLLYIDSGGGAVLQSDEVYLKLMEYKEATDRPIYAYCADYMASGAYYIACAADEIYSNRNGTVGSIGVYIETVDMSRYYDEQGIDVEFIRTGPNKAMGNEYEPLTDEQRSIYQGVVDECYDQFVDIVCDSRGYTREELLPIADGRIYTATQGVNNGLIDGTCGSDEIVEKVMNACHASDLYVRSYTTPGLAGWLGMMVEAIPKSESEILFDELAEIRNGRPMYHV